MNKYIIKLCLLASIANVSAASLSEPAADLTGGSASKNGSPVKDDGSPRGHHERGGAAKGFSGAIGTAQKFPSALDVTYGNRTSRIQITPTMRVVDLKDLLGKNFLVSGGHKYMLEVMPRNVDPATNALITLADVFSGHSGIVTLTIQKDETRSPRQTNTSTPAPQAGGMSPAMKGGNLPSPATKPVEGDGVVPDESLHGGDTPPKAAAE